MDQQNESRVGPAAGQAPLAWPAGPGDSLQLTTVRVQIDVDRRGCRSNVQLDFS